jgi:hypothetical protein
MSKYYCLDHTSETYEEIMLQGGQFATKYKYISFRIEQCKNSSTAEICQSQNAIDEYFSNLDA